MKKIEQAMQDGLVSESVVVQTSRRKFDSRTKTVDLPHEIKLEECDRYQSRDRYIAYMKSGCLVERTTTPLGFEVIAYWERKRSKPVYREVLDQNLNVKTQEHFEL